MKQIQVLHNFRDKYNYSHIYGVGEVVSFDDERANDIVGRGLGLLVDVPTESKKHEPSEPSANANNVDGKQSEGECSKSSENEEKNGGTDTEDANDVHEQTATKETKKPKRKGSRNGGKKDE